MDFGLGLLLGQNPSDHHHQLVLEGKPRSGSIKQDRSDPYDFDDGGIRVSKMAKRADDLGQLRSNVDDVICLPKEQMLSFSSTKPELKNPQNIGFSYFHTPTGLGSGNLNGEMYGAFTGIRGPFTPAQWIELEHQAMIFKYFIANIPVPANLLVPIRKAISSSGFPGFSVGSYPSHSYGWGSFHLGFSGSTDPEPGRCRRTDGKKWRCSRDAVPDQKYCERHINRGRHRSRKPVEGLTGQAASGPTTTATKGIPAVSAAMSSLVTSSSGGASNAVTIAQHQIKGFQSSGGANADTDTIVNSRFKDQQELTAMSSTMNFKSKDDPPFSILKQDIPLDESSQLEFGLVSTDSLLNPSQKGSYFNCKTYDSSLLELNDEQTQDPLRHFTDEWSKDHQSNPSTLPWTEELKSDWTQLSMSIPISRVGPIAGSKYNSRIPTPWVNTMGGPLGEVLLKNASPKVGSSPTGVLQESTFVSLSNTSSGGSSPKEGASCKC